MKATVYLRRRWASLTSWSVLGVAVVALIASAVFADGYPARHVSLNDGGIWVTSNTDGLFGRVNKPAGSLDAAFYPPGGAQQGYQIDVVQDGAAVAAWDRAIGLLYPVDVDRAAVIGDRGTGVPVSADEQVQLSGGTLAVLNPATGDVFAARVDTALGIRDLYALSAPSKPVANIGAGRAGAAALAVGPDGTVYAVAATGKVATVDPSAGGFALARYSQLSQVLTAVRATVVGTRLVVFDPATATVVVPGGATATLGTVDPSAVPQVPGPAAASVLIATSRALFSVDLGTGVSTPLWTGGQGAPAAPVRLGDCVHAAWAATSDGYVRACGGAPAAPGNVTDTKALVHPEFRLNRGSIVLNDLATGTVWDLSTSHDIGDWGAVRPPVAVKPGKDKHDQPGQLARDQAPKPHDDLLHARAGRTTLLHVLDNDSDPSGNILSISQVSGLDSTKAQIAVSPDGQTVALTLPAQSPSVHFKYTVDDGIGHNASAAVTVDVRTPDQNDPPALRAGAKAPAYTVPAGGRISMPVLGDWRDPDGDPVVLVGAAAKTGTATATADGFVDFAAPATGGPVVVTYQVSDGIGAPVSHPVTVTVQAPQNTTGIAAVALPDVGRGQVGQPIVVHPLDNDLPGSDPTDPAARLQLAADLASPSGTQVDTDLHNGTVTVTAARPGTYLLDYQAEYGDAPFAAGHIRVDVAAVPAKPLPPVAMPDVAILHGEVAATVDVLDNDYDPAGNVLVVQQAAPVGPQPQVSVAVIAGHWLRITALAPQISPNPQFVRYTVTDGTTSPVTGEVSVTQLAGRTDSDIPVAVDDFATVRAGQTVTVPVLDNDTDTTGAPLSLTADVSDAPAPGQLTVTGGAGGSHDVGTAYVTGNFVRYVPPATVTAPLQATVEYLAQDPAGDPTSGLLHVTVEPAPATAADDRAPLPQQVTARVVAGDTVVIPVPTSGVDPDGDPVAVTGIASAPSLGRVLSVNATSLTYQAYPKVGNAGTDSFTYQVTDAYGKTGTATVRVGVVEPGDPQPPVAVDDTVTGRAGAVLDIDVLGNDLRAADDPVTVMPLAPLNPGLATGVSLTGPTGPLKVTVPGSNKPLVVIYAVTDGIGDPSQARVTVRGLADFDEPPVTRDAYAVQAPGATVATVNLAGSVTDPDGAGAALTFTRAFGAQVTADGTLTAPVSGWPYQVAYEVKDSGGATAVGIVHVPGAGGGGPYAKPDQVIQVPRDGSRTVAVADYVIDPAHQPLTLTTTDRISASPDSGLQVRAQGATQLLLTGRNGYVGPAAITFQVTDGTSVTDPAGHTVTVTVPVQVGPATPVLRCPPDPIDLVEGGDPVTVNVTSVCHVWVADPETLADLHYSGQWAKQPAGVELTGAGGRTLTLTATAAAVPGSTGTVSVGVTGTRAVPSTLAVRVRAAEPPSVASVTVDGVKDGETATVDMTSYVRSELRDPIIGVVSVTQTGGAPAAATAHGATVTLTPNPNTHGTMTFQVVVSDVPGRPDREATGLITLHVFGPPDAPGQPQVGRTVLSQSVALSWSTPANNGAPISTYTVSYKGGGSGTQDCPASPCTITKLKNGKPYTFSVRAVNAAGAGAASAFSGQAVPNEAPPAVTNLAVSLPKDGSLHLTWVMPTFAGTNVTHYQVTWQGGGHAQPTGPSMDATGLDNDVVYTFTVIPVNALGPGPKATVTGQSAGAPPTPATPTFTWANSADLKTRTVHVSWTSDDPNGPGPTTYTLLRTGGGAPETVCSDVTVPTCDDDKIGNDGMAYTYRVTASNADAATSAGHVSAQSPGVQMTAATTPEALTNVHADPTGADGSATIYFDAPASHGASSTVTCTYNGAPCGKWTSLPTGGQTGVSEPITGLTNGQPATLVLQDCNGSSGQGADSPCDGAVSTSVVTFGPVKSLDIQTSASGPVVNFTVSVDPNGRSLSVHIHTSTGQDQVFSTGVGPWSWPGTDNIGYGQTDTIDVTVSDASRSASLSKQQSTPAPSPSITAWQGVAGTSSIGTCTSPSQNCHWLDFQVHNFPTGRFSWSCMSNDADSYDSAPITLNITDPNQTFHGTNASGECIWGSGYVEGIRIDGYTSNDVPHS